MVGKSGIGAFLLVMILALVGCGRPAPPPAPMSTAPQAEAPAVTVNPPRFGDDAPHPWDVRDPSAYAVHGIDAARFQTDVDWQTAREAGVSFAFLKATEGGDRRDPEFDNHWRGAGAAGIPRGAYHFFYFCRPAIEQARWFIRNVPREKGALPPVLDMEWNAHSPTCRLRPDGAKVRSEAEVFLDALERHYGQRPIVYTTVDFYHDNDMGRLPRVEFWLRSVANHPSKVYPGQVWRFWQYSGTGRVPGFPGRTDLNVFSGSIPQWQDWLARRGQ